MGSVVLRKPWVRCSFAGQFVGLSDLGASLADCFYLKVVGMASYLSLEAIIFVSVLW